MSATHAAAAFVLGLTAATASLADPVEDFYRGKQIHMIVGHPAGGDYDLGGRLLAKYLPKYIPGNPVIVVQNMPTAASVVAANYLYKVAAKDGTAFGSFSRNIPGQAVMGLQNLEADPRKYQWLGATSLPGRICLVRGQSPVKSAEDLFDKEAVMAGAGPGSSLSIVPSVLTQTIGMKFKIVEGYQGAPDGLLAVERGEVDGICNTFGALRLKPEQLRSGQYRVLFRAEEAPFAALPDVPSIYKFIKTEQQAQLIRFIFSSVEFGRPYVMPPEAPADRVQAMRKAFGAALSDPDLLAEARKLDLDMSFRPAEAVAGLVDKLYATPPAMLEQVKKLAPAER